MPDPMMVRLAVSTPDSPPLISSGNGSGGSSITSSNNNNSNFAHQTDQTNVVTSTTTPPVQSASVSPTQQQQNSHQMAQNIPPGAIPLNQITPHHIPSFHHHPTGSNGGVPHIHDHNNGHHHNGLYLPYQNEFYPAGSEGPPHYYIPPELCPAHTQICTVHPEYGPVTVPMVSQSGSPPIPMPHVQVPPGHVMQQIVDENGTLRHVILSTHHQQLQGSSVQHHIHGHYITANGSTPHSHYFSPIASYPPAGAAPSNQSQATASTNQLYPTMNHQPVSHSPSPPSNTNGSSSNNNSTTNNNNYQNNERAHRQHQKLMRKLESRNNGSTNINNTNQVHSQTTRINSSNNDNLNGLSGNARRNLQRNGTNSSAGGASSVGTTSDDGEESSSVPDDEDDFQNVANYLSSIEPPVVSEIQSHTALITWEPPPAPTSTDTALNNLNTSDIRYEILLGDRGKDGKYKSIFRGTNLSCRIQHLRAGQDYYVSLVAHHDEVHGETTDPVLFTTPAREPDQPSPPKLFSKTKNSLQLRWNAPNDNGAPIQYILEMKNEAEHDYTEIVKTKAKQFTVSKLQPATCYKFRLSALNELGKSEYSVPISYVTDGYPPPQPMPPKLANLTTSSIALTWFRRREDGDFILQMAPGLGSQGFLNVYYGPDTKYECTRLQRATSYQFRLASKTDSGQSSWSDEIAIVTLPEAPGRPSKPIVKGKIHAYNFKVKWDQPIDRGGADVSLYHLEISSGGIYERVYSGQVNEALCDRLNPGTTYQVRVLAEGPGGVSQPSDTCTVTTEAIVPNPPQTPYYSNLPGPYAAVLQWEKPEYLGGAPVVEYELELEGIINDGAEKTKQRLVAYRGKDCYCVVKDLLPGESYTTRVRAVNRIGAGEWSEEFGFRAGSAPPSKPMAPEVFVRSPTHLHLQWREPQSNGAPILDYKLESSTNQEEDVFSVVYHGTETSADLKDLLPFTTYFFRLHAVNASGRSPLSPTISQKTPAAAPGIPQLLTDLFTITSNTAHIFWNEPECNGDPIINYILECGDRHLSTNSNKTDLFIDHLNPETIYKVKVQAVNRIGAGVFTQFAKFTTKPLPPKPPRLECIQYGYNSLKLKWGNDGSSNSSTKSNATNIMHDFQRFEVDMKIKSSSKDFQNIYTGTRNSIKVQKLHESTVYSFRICAQTEHAGVGQWSDEYLFKTQAAQPNTVKIVKCIESIPMIAGESHADAQPSLMIEWQNSKNNHFNDAIEYILQKALANNGNVKNLTFEDIYRGSDTKFTIDSIDSGVVYSLRVIPVRLMKSKRTTSIGSTRTSSHDGFDEVDGSSDESDSDDERVNQTPVTYEDICGAPSPVVNYKLPKPEELQAAVVTTTINQQLTGSTRKGLKPSKSSPAQQQLTANKKNQLHHQTNLVQEPLHESSSSDESSIDVVDANQSLFLKIVNSVRAFFDNRSNWSVTEESFIICFGFMFFTILVGCILHYLMA